MSEYTPNEQETRNWAVKSFKTLDVVSAYTGKLAGSIDGLYEVLGYLLSDPGIMTHQLPAASHAAESSLARQHPWLTELPPITRTDFDTDDEYLSAFGKWCLTIIDEHGPETNLRRALEEAAWLAGNALRDLADIAGNRKIFGINLDSGGN